MKSTIAAAVLLGILVCTTAARGQEAVTIKVRTAAEGDTLLVSKSETVTTKVKVVDGKGNVLADLNNVESGKFEYQETVLKQQGIKPPTKLARAYTKAERTKGTDVTDLELAGKTVIIENKEGKYAFAFKDGAALAGQALAVFTKEFGKKTDSDVELDKLVLPKKAVKPGETWKLDMGPILKQFLKSGGGEMDVDTAKATGSGKLVKAYNKAGRLYGVMQFKLDVPLKSAGKGPAMMKFGAGAKLILDVDQDICIDGSADTGSMKMKMLMSGSAEIPNLPGGSASLNVTAEGTTVQRDVAKKK